VVAVLGKRQFFSLGQWNEAIRDLVAKLNQKPFPKLPGSRTELYGKLDQPALARLPPQRYWLVQGKKVRVGWDYHVEVEGYRPLHGAGPRPSHPSSSSGRRLSRQPGARVPWLVNTARRDWNRPAPRLSATSCTNWQNVRSILASGLDQQSLPQWVPAAPPVEHDHIRGAGLRGGDRMTIEQTLDKRDSD
jgi:hypothetical protein